MFVKCILVNPFLTKGKWYQVVDLTKNSYKVRNNMGVYEFINKKYFEVR